MVSGGAAGGAAGGAVGFGKGFKDGAKTASNAYTASRDVVEPAGDRVGMVSGGAAGFGKGFKDGAKTTANAASRDIQKAFNKMIAGGTGGKARLPTENSLSVGNTLAAGSVVANNISTVNKNSQQRSRTGPTQNPAPTRGENSRDALQTMFYRKGKNSNDYDYQERLSRARRSSIRLPDEIPDTRYTPYPRSPVPIPDPLWTHLLEPLSPERTNTRILDTNNPRDVSSRETHKKIEEIEMNENEEEKRDEMNQNDYPGETNQQTNSNRSGFPFSPKTARNMSPLKLVSNHL